MYQVDMLWRVNPLQQPLHIQGRTMSQQKERQLQRSWRAPLERDTFRTCPAPIPNSCFMLHQQNTVETRGVDGALRKTRNRGIWKEFWQSSRDTWWHEGRTTPNTHFNMHLELQTANSPFLDFLDSNSVVSHWDVKGLLVASAVGCVTHSK